MTASVEPSVRRVLGPVIDLLTGARLAVSGIHITAPGRVVVERAVARAAANP